MNRSILAAIILATGFALHSSARPAAVTVAVTADTEGHVNPCAGCSHGAGNGGLARRATAVGTLRAAGALLLVDAGNALFGPESLDSGGAVIVDAYNRLDYDAVNLSFRDFRLGKDATLELLKRATFAAVSANVLDAATGRPLARPYAVREVSGQRVAIIGLSEQPAGMGYLPHLKRQLAGVRFAAPAEALAQTLPKAKAEADVVVVLYYGSAGGAQNLAETAGTQVAAILVGGAPPDGLSQANVPLVAAEQHGKSITRLTLQAGTGGSVGPHEQLAIDDSIAADPGMAALLLKSAPAHSDPTNGTTAAADSNRDGGRAEADAQGIRPLVEADVKPLEPEPARQPAGDPQADIASAERPTPEQAAGPHSRPKPAAGGGVFGFLKSLINRPNGAVRPAARDSQPDVSTGTPAAAEPPDTSADAPPTPTTTAESPTAAPTASGPKFCTNCGAKLARNSKFCTACGTRVRR